jgi:hypothetical protein
MFQSIIFSVLSISGVAVLWRKLLHDHPVWKDWIVFHMPVLGKALTCGLCFTYWLALFFVLWRNPLPNWTGSVFVVHVSLSWMVVAFISVFLRFSYVAIQELVHYQVHHLRQEHHH